MPGAAVCVSVVVLAFSSGGYFPSDHGLLILAFGLVVLTAVLVADRVALDRRSLVLVGGLAALALWALASVAWAPAAARPVLEAERGLLYAVAAAALVLVVTRGRTVSLLAGLVTGVTVVALYALATRLFPGRVGGAYDPSSGYQLAEPIGYSNALGLLLTFGLLLGAGFALRGESLLRVPAAAALVPLAAALYFTYGRGAVAAGLVGLLVLLALARPPVVSLAAMLAPAAAIVLASRPTALNRAGETLATAQAQGQRLAWQLAVLSLVGAALAWSVPRLPGRVRGVRLGGLALLAAAAVALSALALAVTVREGGPAAVVDRALAAFRRDPPASSQELPRRLLSVSGHGREDYWRVAARMVAREPLLGEGAGGFERRWIEERPAAHGARDAHNLYLETLAELGPIGLALLLVALATPLTALPAARRRPLSAPAAAAYAAFLVHAGVDWDWELPVLVLSALACAVVLVAESRTAAPARLTALRRGAGILAVASVLGVALVAHVGNRALAEGFDALERGNAEAAMTAARRARAWAPWSHEPWQLLGEAQLARRENVPARRSLEEAARRAPEEWSVWSDLAVVSEGPEEARAITRARELNPLGDETRDPGNR